MANDQITQGTLTPAYGRDYKGKTSAITDFRDGKDFTFNLMTLSTYCSIRDCKPGDMVKIRYNKLTKVCFYTVTEGDLSET